MSYKRVMTKKNIIGWILIITAFIGINFEVYTSGDEFIIGFVNILYGIVLFFGFIALVLILVSDKEYKYIESKPDPNYKYIESKPDPNYKYIANTIINRKLYPKGELVLMVEE